MKRAKARQFKSIKKQPMARVEGLVKQVCKDLINGNCAPRVERDRTKYRRKDKHKSKGW